MADPKPGDEQASEPDRTRPGYPEPQPDDADEARHRGKQPGPDREDGGLQRDEDGEVAGGPSTSDPAGD